jgi:hypothetical protein
MFSLAEGCTIMISRFEKPKPFDPQRAKNTIVLDNLTAQTPLIEFMYIRRRRCIRIWTAYDYERVLGTYIVIFPSGLVQSVTEYPNGRREVKIVRPADRR